MSHAAYQVITSRFSSRRHTRMPSAHLWRWCSTALFTRILIFWCCARSCLTAPLANALTLAKSPRSTLMHSQLPGKDLRFSSLLASSHLQHCHAFKRVATLVTLTFTLCRALHRAAMSNTSELYQLECSSQLCAVRATM